MLIKYFDSQILMDENELEEEKAMEHGHYNKVYFEDNTPVKSEFYSKDEITRVVYFYQDAKNADISTKHLKAYGNIEFEVCNPFKENDLHCQHRFYFDANAVLVSSWIYKGKEEWNWDEQIMFSPQGEKLEIVKYIHDESGNLLKEVHYRGDGSFWFELDEEDKF